MQQALDAISLIEEYGAPTLLAGVKARDAAQALREALAHPSEPFGYFRAEPFGWTDCDPTDEGAKALYDHPEDTPAWHDAPTCAGLWICDEASELKYEWRVQRVKWPLHSLLLGEGERWYGPIPKDAT